MTRNSVLRKLNTWLCSEPSPNGRARVRAHPCLLVTGIAGVGKTAIAITTVECLQDGRGLANETLETHITLPLPVLCAQYFFNHTLDSARLERLFPTLAVQLAQNSPITASLIRNAIQNTPSVLNHFGLEQAVHLFVNPLRELARIHAPRVVTIVIDGIDELELGGNTHSTALVEVSTILLQVAPLLPHNARLLLFSRPEAPIMDVLAASDDIIHLQLRTTESERDVDVLVRDTLAKLSRTHRLTGKSISGARLSLCKAAAGHLGWAKQALQWLSSNLEFEGEGGFNEAIEDISCQATGSLDVLYSLILARMLPPSSQPDLRERYLMGLNMVLGVLLTLEEPQRISTINRLVAAMLRDHFNTLHCLKRLGVIYDADGVNGITESTIAQVHKSFHDFLLSADRAPCEFQFDPSLANSRLASACFAIMLSNELRFNMGQFTSLHESRSMLNRVEETSRVPGHIRYACLSFHYHVAQSKRFFTNELREWVSTKFMFWLEILIMFRSNHSPLTNGLASQLLLLPQCTSGEDSALIARAVGLFIPFIKLLRNSGPLGIYLIAVPLNSSDDIRSICPFPHIVTLCCRKDRIRQQKIGRVNFLPPLMVSPSGRHAAFISTRADLSLLSLFDGDIRRVVSSVQVDTDTRLMAWSFSQDSATLIIAYSTMNQVALVLVDTLSGTERKKWIIDPASDFANFSSSNEISRVQICPGGSYVLLSTIPTLDAHHLVYHDGRPIWFHSSWIHPHFLDHRTVLFQSRREVYTMDCETGDQRVLILPGTVKVASASQMGTVVLVTTDGISICCKSRTHGWREAMRTEVEEGTRVACLSSDGCLFVLGMKMGSIQVWRLEDSSDLLQWKHITTLSGQIRDIEGLAFSADNRQVVSYSLDGEIRIWDISAIKKGIEWDVKVAEGALAESSWFKHGIPLGGWFIGNQPEVPTPFLFQYPFQLPQDVINLNWNLSQVDQ